LLLPGVSVNPMDIASSLIVLMLIPLTIGLFVKARYEDTAASLQKSMAQTSNTALMIIMVLGLVLNFNSLIGVIGTGAILALLLFIVLSFVIGYFLGGPDQNTKPVLGLGTAQRNVAAALVVGAQNFSDPGVITMVIVGAVLMLVVLMLTGGELGKRNQQASQRVVVRSFTPNDEEN
jgi:predicted Na+-dependent transporter